MEENIPTSDSSAMAYLKDIDYCVLDEPLFTNPTQIENIIKTLNPVGGGIDKISTNIIKGTYQKCLQQLTYFFNPRLLGLWIFHRLLGGGAFERPPP